MAPAGKPISSNRGRANSKSALRPTTATYDRPQSRGRRIEKTPSRARGCTGPGRAGPRTHRRFERLENALDTNEARDTTDLPPGMSPKASRTPTTLHACSDLSLHFATLAGLATTPDTNTIALNLMDYFLFSPTHWLPDLSYCRLHAACFLIASLATAQPNAVEDIARSLAPETAFVAAMAAPLAEDEKSAVAIQEIIGVEMEDVQMGYGLLCERREELVGVMGEYGVERLPEPTALFSPVEVEWSGAEGEEGTQEVEDFDVYEEQ